MFMLKYPVRDHVNWRNYLAVDQVKAEDEGIGQPLSILTHPKSEHNVIDKGEHVFLKKHIFSKTRGGGVDPRPTTKRDPFKIPAIHSQYNLWIFFIAKYT